MLPARSAPEQSSADFRLALGEKPLNTFLVYKFLEQVSGILHSIRQELLQSRHGFVMPFPVCTDDLFPLQDLPNRKVLRAEKQVEPECYHFSQHLARQCNRY